jgi:hypothetical protein
MPDDPANCWVVLRADGRLDPSIGVTLGWEKTAEAFAALSRREVRGKAVPTI